MLATVCMLASLVQAAERGRSGERPPAGKPPGGNWSEPKREVETGHNVSSEEKYGKNKSSQTTGKEDAAAGAAAANRNQPKTTGKEDAAAGAAAVNHRDSKATAAEGVAAGAAVANRNQPQVTVTGGQGTAAGYAAVKNSFDHPELYGQQWHASHPDAWTPAGWAAGTAWTPTAWSAVAGYYGYGRNTPISYQYGVNVKCVDGNVLVDGQNVGTAGEFSQQAADLALAGAEAKTSAAEKWLPLGVFALVRNAQQHPQLILQLAVNQQGDLRGNYTDDVTEHNSPIRGAVDKKTMRVAWTVGDNTTSIMEVGLNNLTNGEAPALLHKNGKTELWYLVRLEQPK